MRAWVFVLALAAGALLRLLLLDVRPMHTDEAVRELARLPPALARLEDAPEYPVEIAPALVHLAAEVDRATASPTATRGRPA